jgi:glycerate kinase
MDASTFMGKATGRIAERCQRLKIPCSGLAGQVGAAVKRKHVLSRMRALTDLTSLKQAKSRPAYWLERLAAEEAEKQRLKTLSRYFPTSSRPAKIFPERGIHSAS